MLVRCLYASRSKSPIADGLVSEILAQSRRNNPRHGITGLLCHTDRIFLQVLEGGRDEVCELFNRIVSDGRHEQVRLLSYSDITERRFASWAMGKVNVDTVNPALLLKYSERAELNPFTSSGEATMALISELLATGSIASRNSG